MILTGHKGQIATAAVIGLGLSIWIGTRWNVWFGNPPEEAYTTSTAPHNVMLTMGAEGGLSRIVSWCAGSTEGRGQDRGYLTLVCKGHDGAKDDTTICEAQCQSIKTRGGKVAIYRALLKTKAGGLQLPPGQEFAYKVTANRQSSPWYTMLTAGAQACDTSRSQEAQACKFIYMGDVQDSLGGLTRSINAAIAQREPDADFWLFGGDLTERPTNHYWEATFWGLQDVATSKPMVNIMGNHEYLKGVIKEPDPRFAPTFAYFAEYKKALDDAEGLKGCNVFSFAVAGTRFYLLDSNADCWYLPLQRAWLRQQREASREEFNIVVLHHPLHSNKGASYNLLVKMALGATVEDGGFDLVLQGHEHVYARWCARRSNGSGKEVKSSPVYLTSYCSPKQYRLFFGAAEEDRIGTGDRFYQVVECRDHKLDLKAYTASDDRLYDHLVIDKASGTVAEDAGLPAQKVEMTQWYKANKNRKRVDEYQKDLDEWKKSH